MRYHPIIFYVDPSLITATVDSDLSGYVDDMNIVLAKNTSRRLVYGGYVPSMTAPHDDIGPVPIPTDDFQLWVYIQPSGVPDYSTGGYIAVDSSGAGVIDGMLWGQVYHTDALDRSKQLYTMLHEFAHIFNAGIGEYYSLITVPDASGKQPLQNIDMLNPANPFAAAHVDWRGDPLLWNVGGLRDVFLAGCKFADVTALTIDSNWRAGIDTLTSFKIVKSTQGPISDLVYTAYVYGKNGMLLQFGEFEDEFIVNGWGNYRNADNNAKLVKVFRGARFIAQRWVTPYDLDRAKLTGTQYVMTV